MGLVGIFNIGGWKTKFHQDNPTMLNVELIVRGL